MLFPLKFFLFVAQTPFFRPQMDDQEMLYTCGGCGSTANLIKVDPEIKMIYETLIQVSFHGFLT